MDGEIICPGCEGKYWLPVQRLFLDVSVYREPYPLILEQRIEDVWFVCANSCRIGINGRSEFVGLGVKRQQRHIDTAPATFSLSDVS